MDIREGPSHYVRCAIQPWDIIDANGLDFYEGNVLKYLLRWKNKDGVKDLYKARHYLEKLISVHERKETLADKHDPIHQFFEQHLSNADISRD